MIDFNENFKTYTCPHCGCRQSFDGKHYDKLSASNAFRNTINGTILSLQRNVKRYEPLKRRPFAVLKCI